MIKLTIFGDSISTITHGDGGYIKRLQKYPIYESIETLAISGSGLSSQTPNNLYSMIVEKNIIPKNSNWILIWHGTNDWFYGSSLEKFETELIKVIDQIRISIPNIELVYLLPIYRFETPFETSIAGNAFITKNRVNLTLQDYRRSLIKVLTEQNVDYIDMTTLSQEFEINVSMFFEDRVHPNALGMDVIANIIHNYFMVKVNTK